MKKYLTSLFMLIGLTAHAETSSFSNIYLGGGISHNSLDGFEDAIGLQVFAGYIFDLTLGSFTTAAELGYMDSGDFKFNTNVSGVGTIEAAANGVWAAGVTTYPISDNWEILGRLGYDFGDDDGALIGAGIMFSFSDTLMLRGEYVARDDTDSLQLNLVYAIR